MSSMSKRDFLAAAAGFGAAGFGMAAFAGSAPGRDAEPPRGDSVFNVRDFGAKGDGKTSDSKAVQAALDAAGKVSGTVWFPSGIYLCHALKVPEHVTLKADSTWHFRKALKGAVLKLDDPDASCMLDITGAYGVHMNGLLLEGIPSAANKVHGIFLNNRKFSPKENSFYIENTKVQNFSGHGAYLKRAWHFFIRHSQFYQNGGCGVMLHGWDGFVLDNQFSYNGIHGFGCEEVGAAIMFTGNRVEWNKGHGLSLCEWSTWNVTGTSFDRNHGAGIYATRLNSSTFTGNTFNRNGRDPSTVPGGDAESCHIQLVKCRGITATANVGIAGRDDAPGGELTPKYAIVTKKLSCSVVKDNAFVMGYTDQLLHDLGEHGPDFIFKDNVGSAAKK